MVDIALNYKLVSFIISIFQCVIFLKPLIILYIYLFSFTARLREYFALYLQSDVKDVIITCPSCRTQLSLLLTLTANGCIKVLRAFIQEDMQHTNVGPLDVDKELSEPVCKLLYSIVVHAFLLFVKSTIS